MTADLLIRLDDAHDPGNEEGPRFDGPLDAPVWGLYIVTVEDDNGEWVQTMMADGKTYQEALDLVSLLGLSGLRIIGGSLV